MKKTILAAILASAATLPAWGFDQLQVTGVVVAYAPAYLNPASSGDGYIDESKGPVAGIINARNGFKLRNKGLPPRAGGASDERAHRVYFSFGSTLSDATNLTLKASMTGVPSGSGTWRLVITKADQSTVNYNCNFNDTSANCFDGVDRIIKFANVAGAAAGYIEVEGMPSGSEITLQKLRFTINDDGNPNTTGANEYDLEIAYK